MYGIEIPISTYRTQGAITFKVLSLKHTEISASRYFLCYKKGSCPDPFLYICNYGSLTFLVVQTTL